MASSRATIAGFEIGKKLGAGAFGTVHECVELSSGDRYAVKILDRLNVADVSDVERVSREFFILTDLQHENVIGLYKVEQSAGVWYLFMELATEGSLKDVLRSARTAARKCLRRQKGTTRPPSLPQLVTDGSRARMPGSSQRAADGTAANGIEGSQPPPPFATPNRHAEADPDRHPRHARRHRRRPLSGAGREGRGRARTASAVTIDRQLALAAPVAAPEPMDDRARRRKHKASTGVGTDECTARWLFKQLCQGVAYFHGRRVVHRDLKPDNILIDGAGTLKIADFGLSIAVSAGGRASTPVGTPLYSAPEILFGPEAVESAAAASAASAPSARGTRAPASSGLPAIPVEGYSASAADVWSLGVILYELIYGHLPFPAADRRELRRMILREKLVIPTTTRQLLMHALDSPLDLPAPAAAVEAITAAGAAAAVAAANQTHSNLHGIAPVAADTAGCAAETVAKTVVGRARSVSAVVGSSRAAVEALAITSSHPRTLSHGEQPASAGSDTPQTPGSPSARGTTVMDQTLARESPLRLPGTVASEIVSITAMQSQQQQQQQQQQQPVASGSVNLGPLSGRAASAGRSRGLPIIMAGPASTGTEHDQPQPHTASRVSRPPSVDMPSEALAPFAGAKAVPSSAMVVDVGGDNSLSAIQSSTANHPGDFVHPQGIQTGASALDVIGINQTPSLSPPIVSTAAAARPLNPIAVARQSPRSPSIMGSPAHLPALLEGIPTLSVAGNVPNLAEPITPHASERLSSSKLQAPQTPPTPCPTAPASPRINDHGRQLVVADSPVPEALRDLLESMLSLRPHIRPDINKVICHKWLGSIAATLPHLTPKQKSRTGSTLGADRGTTSKTRDSAASTSASDLVSAKAPGISNATVVGLVSTSRSDATTTNSTGSSSLDDQQLLPSSTGAAVIPSRPVGAATLDSAGTGRRHRRHKKRRSGRYPGGSLLPADAERDEEAGLELFEGLGVGSAAWRLQVGRQQSGASGSESSSSDATSAASSRASAAAPAKAQQGQEQGEHLGALRHGASGITEAIQQATLPAAALDMAPSAKAHTTAQPTASQQQACVHPAANAAASPVRAVMHVGRAASAEQATTLDDSDRMRAVAAHNASLYATPDLAIDMDSAMGMIQPSYGSTHSSATEMDCRTPASSSRHAPWDPQTPPTPASFPVDQHRQTVKLAREASADATAKPLRPLGTITRQGISDSRQGSAEGSARARSGSSATQHRRHVIKGANSAGIGSGRNALGVIHGHRRGGRPHNPSAISGGPAGDDCASTGSGMGGSAVHSSHLLHRKGASASPASGSTTSDMPQSRPASQRLPVRVSRFRSQDSNFLRHDAHTPSDGSIAAPSGAHRFPTLPAEPHGTAGATIAAARQEANSRLEPTPAAVPPVAQTNAGAADGMPKSDQVSGLPLSLDHVTAPQPNIRRRSRRLSLPSLASTTSFGALGVSTAQPTLKGSSLRFMASQPSVEDAPVTASATLAPFKHASSKQAHAAGTPAVPAATPTPLAAGETLLSSAQQSGTEVTVPASTVPGKTCPQPSLPQVQLHHSALAASHELPTAQSAVTEKTRLEQLPASILSPHGSTTTILNTGVSIQHSDSAQSSASQAEVLVQAAAAGSVILGVGAASSSASGLPQTASAPTSASSASGLSSSRAVLSPTTHSRPPRDPTQPKTPTTIPAARSSPSLQGLVGSAGTSLPGLGAISLQGPLLVGQTGLGLASLDRSAASGASTSFHSRMRRVRSLRVHTSSGAGASAGKGTGGGGPGTGMAAAAAVNAAGVSSKRSVSSRGAMTSSSTHNGMLVISSATGARDVGAREFSSGGSSASASGRSSVTAGLDPLSPHTAPPFNRGISGTSNITAGSLAGSSRGQSDLCDSDLDLLHPHDTPASIVDSSSPHSGDSQRGQSGNDLVAIASGQNGLPVIIGKPKTGSARTLR